MTPYLIEHESIAFLPILHYNLETAALTAQVCRDYAPDCIAIELPTPLQSLFARAVARLPDLSLITAQIQGDTQYYMIEPCDALLEGLRSAQELNIDAYCIDYPVAHYPAVQEPLPDPYSIFRVGLEPYYTNYANLSQQRPHPLDEVRELYMARRLKELSFSYDRILCIVGMAHVAPLQKALERSSFPESPLPDYTSTTLSTLSEEGVRQCTATSPYLLAHYERLRTTPTCAPDRQALMLQLYKEAAYKYTEATGNTFPPHHFRNMMKFLRNWSLLYGQLQPDFFQIVSAAQGCVDHNYAYETWALGTEYFHYRNIDNLPITEITPQELWGNSKRIHFRLRQPSRKESFLRRQKNSKKQHPFRLDHSGTLCSYPKEDLLIENFGHYLRKKGEQILLEEGQKTIPFTTSIEDGIDVKETIRHRLSTKKIYVRSSARPSGQTGSVVVIFSPDDEPPLEYPWLMTWHGEHEQESDMAFYATPMFKEIVGPGISRCTYGGLMMTYPPRRVQDVWSDPDYEMCRTKAEILLMAAIDYAVDPVVVYVAAKPPRSYFKSFAQQFGKKLVYVPIGNLSPTTLQKLRTFHVLDSYHRRDGAEEYII